MSHVEEGTNGGKRAARAFTAALIGALAVLLVAIAAPSAQAEFGITPGTFRTAALDAQGNELTRAGAHPDVSTSFTLNSTTDEQGNIVPDEDLRDVRVQLPVGLVGDPTVGPQCARDEFNSAGAANCSPETQVGVVDLLVSTFTGEPQKTLQFPVYNIVPPPDRPAQFGFRVLRSNVVILADVRSGSDYGITATIKNIPGGLQTFETRLTLWGVPADTSHDALRYLPGQGFPGRPRDDDPFTNVPFSVNTTRKAFFTSPTHCSPIAPVTSIAIRSWQNPDRWSTAEAQSPLVTDCDRLSFDPQIELAPRSARVAAPSGYDVTLSFRQPENPAGVAYSTLKDAVVTLPAGTVVNPSSADGLQACSPEQIALTSTAQDTCPEASKIGSVSIDTPLLANHLVGSVYLQRQTPTQLLGLYLTANGNGVTVKLAGTVDPDPITGQLRATFVNNPQLPVRSIALSFKDGPRAPLSNPRTCGPAVTTATLTPWSGLSPLTPIGQFIVSGDGAGSPCPARRFTPAFAAGTRNAVAGAYSPLNVTFGRQDGDEFFNGIAVRLPKGVLARIAAANLCGDGQANAGTCGEDSRIGSVTTAAGAGSNPLQLPGRVYVTGPYKGAPFGLSIVVPAVAGPFDLGTVVVRASIAIDRETAQLTITSDPLPRILKGIPLQIRMVDVAVDRARFALNPTNCTPARVDGAISSTAGDGAAVSDRFQVAGCARLPFAPKMTLKVGARGATNRGNRTPLQVSLSMTPGQANNRSVRVTLPKTLNARLDVVNRRVACTIEQFRADKCPMVVGTATALTPLLRDPLRGAAYFVYNPDRRLPDLVVRLKGQVSVDLVGKVTITRDLKLETTFDTVPDVPISRFTLKINGGKKGAIGVVRNLCVARNARATVANLRLDAQSGKRVIRKQKIAVSGCGKKRTAAPRRAARAKGRR